jgi:hypothetical protein
MKCPQCQANQKYSEGMICNSCGYQFALNPKEVPRITDIAFKIALDRLSGYGQHYFTYYQLYAQIYRLLGKKDRKGRIGCIIALAIIGLLITFMGSALVKEISGFGWWLPALLLILVVVGIVKYARRPIKVSPGTVVKVINTYQELHPTEQLVDGKRFEGRELTKVDPEIFRYAPEQILIVQRNDIADMLLLNRFHFENKTLVVSANKYPQDAFLACQQFLLQHPDIPISIIHDASSEGLKMKEKLLADKSWNLEGKRIQDMGLFPEDLDQIKNPIWLPMSVATLKPGGKVRTYESAEENVRQGLRMPVDVAPPRAMMGAMTIAMAMGFALLSEELLGEMERQGTRGGDAGGGGYG